MEVNTSNIKSIKVQIFTKKHWLTLGLFFLINLWPFASHTDSGGGVIMYLIFMFSFSLIISFRTLWKVLLFSIITTVVLLIINVFSVILVFLCIFFYIKRIQFFKNHSKELIAAFLVYMAMIPILSTTSFLNYSELGYGYGSDVIFGSPIPVIVALLSALWLHLILVWFYRWGYNSKTATAIIGGLPLFIISFLLPFLKIVISLDSIDAHFVKDEFLELTQSSEDKTIHVPTHERTLPDGDITNNLSYHGSDATPIDPEHTITVQPYDKTTPDNDVTNNWSYHEDNDKSEGKNNLNSGI